MMEDQLDSISSESGTESPQKTSVSVGKCGHGSIVVGGNFTQKMYGLPNESLSQQNPTNVARGKKFV